MLQHLYCEFDDETRLWFANILTPVGTAITDLFDSLG